MVDRWGYTPLYCAMCYGHLAIGQFLVKHGANVNHITSEGFTSLGMAATYGYEDCAKFLIDKGAVVNVQIKDSLLSELHLAARRGHHSVAKRLIDNGASLNQRDAEDNTPAHIACRYGHLEFLKVLVEAGADLSIKNKKGWTPFHEAFAKGGNNRAMVKYVVNILGRDRSHAELVDLLDAYCLDEGQGEAYTSRSTSDAVKK